MFSKGPAIAEAALVELHLRQMTKSDPWKQFRVLKWAGPLGLLFYLFPTIALVAFGRVGMDSRGMHFLIFGWIAFVLVMLTIIHEMKCPQCGERFYARGLDFWQMTAKCLHCGVPKYAEVKADCTKTR